MKQNLDIFTEYQFSSFIQPLTFELKSSHKNMHLQKIALRGLLHSFNHIMAGIQIIPITIFHKRIQ